MPCRVHVREDRKEACVTLEYAIIDMMALNRLRNTYEPCNKLEMAVRSWAYDKINGGTEYSVQDPLCKPHIQRARLLTCP